MSVTVLFFARLREQIGKSQVVLPAQGLGSVADVWRLAAGGEPPAHTLSAVNQEHTPFDHPVKDGDEVAFFPPITGG